MATESRVLDRVDRQILHALQIDPRAAFARIAAVLAVSEQTVARRYQRMRTTGVLRVVARPEEERLPGTTRWTLRIGCRPGAASGLADALARRGDTSWISIGAGGAQITCQATVTADRSGLLDHLPRASGVLTFSAHQLLHRFTGRGESDWLARGHELDERQRAAMIESASRVRPGDGAALEAADGPLLDALGRDGRVSWAALAAATGWTQRQVAQRVAALTASGAIFFDLDVADSAVGAHAVAGLWFTVAPAALAAAGARLADHPEVAFASAVTGSANLMAMVACPDAPALDRYLTTRVAEIEGVHAVETVPLLTRVKQSHSLMRDGRIGEPPIR